MKGAGLLIPLAAVATPLSLLARDFGTPAPVLSADHLVKQHELSLTLARDDAAGGGGSAAQKSKEDAQQNSGLSQEELAKMAQNPVANLMSFPFLNNFNFGLGPNRVTQ
jgi:hypothetical protein